MFKFILFLFTFIVMMLSYILACICYHKKDAENFNFYSFLAIFSNITLIGIDL